MIKLVRALEVIRPTLHNHHLHVLLLLMSIVFRKLLLHQSWNS